MELEIRNLNSSDFATMKAAWADVVEDSRADPLFMSWAWLYSWWEVWASVYGLELMLLGIYDTAGRLVGIAPLYRHHFKTLAGFQVHRLHFIGNAWRVGPSVRTEYVGLIARQGYEQPVAELVAEHLGSLQWDELVVSDSSQQSAGELGTALSARGDILRVLRSDAWGVRIDTRGSLQQWLEQLGPNTRLKAINRRKLFEGDLQGHWRICEAGPETSRRFLNRLNRFHCQRWGKPGFDELAVNFHEKLLDRLSGHQRPLLSELVCEGQVVSVLYDIQAGNCVYNLQAGFDERFHRKLSLGTLHLGYAIEQAFNTPETGWYDLLAGHGKKTFYKARFKGEDVRFSTLEFVRSPVLKFAHYCQGWLPRRLKSRINRVFRL